MGKVTLIGAGPGDTELITVKGLECLKKADVIVYDRLASEQLLKYAREDAVLIYVGKEAGAHSVGQDEINRILVEQAKKYPHVVRLKGGDSFVFGRGGEEIETLVRENLPYELIPGVTSAVAVPESVGIPVTHRGVSRSFHVVTGHTKDGREVLAEDFETLANLKGTLVFLMGLHNLEWIASNLQACGMAKDMPAAVIANGTLPQERCVRGTLEDIAEKVRLAKITSPAVIVVGKTAALSLADTREKRRFGLVGTPETIERFLVGLAQRDKRNRTETAELIMMERIPLPERKELAAALKNSNVYDWTFFTSRQAVIQFFQTAKESKIDMRRFASCRFAVLGQGTADALEQYGFYADFMPKQANGEAMAEEFVFLYRQQARGETAGEMLAATYRKQPKGGSGSRILFPRAKQGNPKTVELLRLAGFAVKDLPIYDVRGKTAKQWELVDIIKDFVFFSSSGVEAFFYELERTGKQLSSGSRCYCIGRLTEQILRQKLQDVKGEHAVSTVVQAEQSTVEGLLDWIEKGGMLQ